MAGSDGTTEPGKLIASALAADFGTDIHVANGRAVLTVAGEVDIATVERFGAALLEAQGSARVLVDLSELTFLDSSGVNALVAAYHRVPLGGELQVVGLRPNVRRVLEITGLLTMFGGDNPDDSLPAASAS